MPDKTTTPAPEVTTTTLSPEELLRAEELANIQAAVAPDEDTTARPVMVYYAQDAAPDELHPFGVAAGTMYESPTPALAKEFHPKASIIRYADGSDYNARKANAEIKAGENTES